MICYGFDVSQFPRFYDKDLDMYKVLPRPYIWSFDGFPGDKLLKKICIRLGKSSRNIFLGMY